MLAQGVNYSLEQLSDAVRQLSELPVDARGDVQLEVLSHEIAVPRTSSAPVEPIQPGPFMKFQRHADAWRGRFDLELFEHEALGPAIQYGLQVQFSQQARIQHPSRNWIVTVDVTVSKLP